MIDWQAGALVLIALAAAAAAFFIARRRPWLARIQARPIMTANETEFFHRLQKALPSRYVFPQVSFAAFMTDDGRLTGKARWSIRAKSDRKIADFLICDAALNILAIIELDDRTHAATADRQRDAITAAAGYRTLRFQARNKPSVAELAALFEGKVLPSTF